MNGEAANLLLTRIQQLGAIGAILLSLAWLLWAGFRDPSVPFLTQPDDPAWITPEAALDSNAIRVDIDRVPVFTFVDRFQLDAVPAEATLTAQAVAEAQIELNGEPIEAAAPHGATSAGWKVPVSSRVERHLREGSNEIRVRVSNARGPALLKLRIADAAGATAVETDESWTVRAPAGRTLRAVRARDTRIHPQSLRMRAAGEVLVDRAGPLAALFALGVALYLAARRALPDLLRRRPAETVLFAATVFWIAVYVRKASGLPVMMGFDIVGHLAYIDFLRENHAIPLATDGWSMYHPPLGHLLIGLVAGGFGLTPDSAAAPWLYRLPTFLAGLGNVWAAHFVARALFAGAPLRVGLATGFAALLPMNVYMSAYVSNEPLHSFLVSLSLLLATRLLLGRGVDWRGTLGLGAGLGLAILTKFTALLAVPLSALFLALKAWLADGLRAARAAALGCGLLAVVALVGGWFYLRNWLLLDRPIVGNWDLPGNRVWWEQPGFHTLDYYTGFGQALQFPFFAGYHSFWDGVYSTFWGDGLAAGMIRLSTRHGAWNYEFMTVGYWLAFPATVLLIVGVFRALRACFAGEALRPRLAMSLQLAFLHAVAFALLAITLQLPYYAQAKAFYVLCAVVPLSIAAALGLAWLPERLTGARWLPARAAYAGWLTTLVGSITLAFLG